MKKFLLAAAAFVIGTFYGVPQALANYGASGGIQDPAEGWAHLWNEAFWDITIIGIIFAIISVVLLIKYRRKQAGQVGIPVNLSTGMMLGWALIPAFAFMADDFFLALKGWNLWNNYRQVPAERVEIKMTSSMWNWHFEYPNGITTDNELVVEKGKPVMLTMKSTDVVHSLYIFEYKVKEDSMPGRITYMWFYPKKSGEFVMTCTEFCGVLHSKMGGMVKVLEPEEYAKWVEANKPAKVSKAEESKEVPKS